MNSYMLEEIFNNLKKWWEEKIEFFHYKCLLFYKYDGIY
jgi:hypothetical protein